jgi:hypothetical protein
LALKPITEQKQYPQSSAIALRRNVHLTCTVFPLGLALWSTLPFHSREQQPNHRHLDQRFAGLDLPLIILAHSPLARDPTQCAFHYPSPGQDAEATRAWLPFDHFKIPTTLGLAPGSQFLASVGRIGPDLFQAREHWGKPGKQTPSPFSIMQIGRSHVHSQEKTECIHEDMAFAPFHALVRIKPTDPGRFLHRFDADAASMIAALGWAFLPTRSRSASSRAVSNRNQVPGIAKPTKMIEDGLEGEESLQAGNATGNRCVTRKKLRRRWLVTGASVVCHAWVKKADGVVDTPTPHQKDCWDNMYSSL